MQIIISEWFGVCDVQQLRATREMLHNNSDTGIQSPCLELIRLLQDTVRTTMDLTEHYRYEWLTDFNSPSTPVKLRFILDFNANSVSRGSIMLRSPHIA